MFKIKNESAPPAMDSLFESRNECYSWVPNKRGLLISEGEGGGGGVGGLEH